MKSNGDYEWKFSTLGGVTRVNINTGEDIAHLEELDQKLWTVLSCPASGLEMDADTLEMLDLDGDGKIRVAEILSTVDWVKSRLKNLDILVSRPTELPLSTINDETAEGTEILACAKRILKNIGLKKDTISIADVRNSISVFEKTPYNGDGVITEKCTDDDALKNIIKECHS